MKLISMLDEKFIEDYGGLENLPDALKMLKELRHEEQREIDALLRKVMFRTEEKRRYTMDINRLKRLIKENE